LRFFQRYGLQATIDAFGVSRRTLYRWKARLKAAGDNPQALATRSSAPKRLKTSPLSLWAVDIIERVRDGIRRYILNAIDPTSCIALAVALPSKQSRNSAEVLKAMLSANPFVSGYAF